VPESERVMQAISSLRSEIRELRNEVQRMRSAMEEYLRQLLKISSSMSTTLENINVRLEDNRRDLAIRLIYLKAMLLATEYAESSARLKSMEEYLKYLEERLGESEKIFREQYLEIMNAYLQTIDNVFEQFISISQNEFRLMEMTLSMMEDVRRMYELLEPEYIDEDVVRLAVEADISKRLEALEKIKRVLSEATAKLTEASTAYERVQGQLLKFAFRAAPTEEKGFILFLPVTRVKVLFKGDTERLVVDTFGPRFEKNAPLSIEEKLVSYVGDRVEEYPARVNVERVRERLSELKREAREPDEEALVEEMIKGLDGGAHQGGDEGGGVNAGAAEKEVC